MKHWTLSLLALAFFGAMVLSHVPRGLSALDDRRINEIAQLNPDTKVPASRYSVSGSRSGIVTVTDTISGKIIRTFQMDSGVVVRETFLLDGGKTVGASQKDHAVFWDLETGKEIRRFPQRIYGFSHDETKFFTLKYPEGIILLYAYPSLTLISELIPKPAGGNGIMYFSLAPNDQFLVVMFAPNYPESDENYPHGEPSYRTITSVNLFNLETCQEIEEFAQAFSPGFDTGTFSQDSNFIEVKTLFSGKAFFHGKELSIRVEWGTWRFNLKTYQIEKIN